LISGAINGIRGFQEKNEGDSPKPLEILKQRYARGEIDRAEYENKRRDLTV
jgi:putative membrane protein